MQRDPEKIEVEYLQAFADLKDASILEVGCGDGRLTWRYAQHTRRVIGIDPDPDRLASAVETRPHRLRNTVSFTRCHAESLAFPSQSFDGVILAWSL